MSEAFLSLESRIEALSEHQAVIFVAVISERMLHNFRLFDELTNGQDSKRINNVMALVWESLLSPSSKINFELQQEKLAPIEEELETQLQTNDSSFGLRMAFDAVLSLSICLESLIGKRPGAALEVSRLSRSGVETFIEITGELDDVEWDTQPLALDEFDFQSEALDQLDEKLDKPKLRELKALAFNQGVSNIGLEIDG